MPERIIDGRITTRGGRAPGVPGLRVQVWSQGPAGERELGEAITGADGHFRLVADDQGADGLTVAVLDRFGTAVHRGDLPASRRGVPVVRLPRDQLTDHFAEPILLDPGVPPLDTDGLIGALRELTGAVRPDLDDAMLDRALAGARCPIPGTGVFETLHREAWGVLRGDPLAARAFVALAPPLGGGGGGGPLPERLQGAQVARALTSGSAISPCGCAGEGGARSFEDAVAPSAPRAPQGALREPGAPFIGPDHAIPLLAAAAQLEFSGFGPTGLLEGMRDRLCTLEQLGKIHGLLLEVAGDRRALAGRVEGLLRFPFPECPEPGPGPFGDPGFGVPAPCEPLRVCADAAGGAGSGVGGYLITAVSQAVACSGDVITLTGVGFGTTPGQVQFGAVTTNASSWSATSITVTVPAGAGNPLVLILPAVTTMICGRVVEMRPQGRVDTPFEIGVPVIEAFFAGSPWDNPYCVEPGKPIPLQWRVSGETHIRVEVRDGQGNLVASSDPAPSNGIFASLFAPATNQTLDWTATIRAEGACGGVAQAQVQIRITRDPMLVISGIEVTQAIQHFQPYRHLTDSNDYGPDNSLPLAEGKAAWVRVYPDVLRDPAFNSGILGQIDGTLTVERLGATGLWQPIPNTTPGGQPLFQKQSGPITWRATDTYRNRRENLSRSLNWIIPAAEMRGRLRFTATIQTGEELCGGPAWTETIQIAPISRRLQIAVVRVGYDGPPTSNPVPPGTPNLVLGAPPIGAIDAAAASLLLTYPIRAQLTRHDVGEITNNLPLDDPKTKAGGCTPNWETLLDQVQDARDQDGNHAGWFYYGLVAGQTPIAAPPNGVAGCEGETAAGLTGQPFALAHELGHALDRTHAPCGDVGTDLDPYPTYETTDAAGAATNYPDASIGEYGLDINTGAIKSPWSFRDFMSYCNPWVSLVGLKVAAAAPLLGAPDPAAALVQVGGGGEATVSGGPVDMVSVVGRVHEGGRLEITSVKWLNVDTALPGWRAHPARAELLDAEGVVRSDAPVMVRMTSADCGCGGAAAGAAASGGADTGIFQAFIPPSADAAGLRIREGETIHDERAPAGPRPRVKITSCAIDEDVLRVEWATDMDLRAPGGTASIHVQREGLWRAVRIGVTDSSARLPLAELPGGRKRVRVMVHDGFWSAQATGPAISLPGQTPTLAILRPEDGQQLDALAPGLAWAAATDAGGDPAGDQISWLLDGQPIGMGSQIGLPQLPDGGEHVLEATYGELSAAVRVQVPKPRARD